VRRYIRFTQQGRHTFMDNLAAAYSVLDTKRAKGGETGIAAPDYVKLVKSLCRDFPDDLIEVHLIPHIRGLTLAP
jgi:hypothetical protein